MDFDFLNKDAKNNKISKKDCFTTITSKSSQNFDVVANDKYSKTKNSSQNTSLTAFYNAIQTDNEHLSQAEIQNFISMLQEEELNTINTHMGIHSVTSRIENFCKQLVNQNNPDYFNNKQTNQPTY